VLRPLKLVHVAVKQLESSTARREDGNVRDVRNGQEAKKLEEADGLVETLDVVPGEMRTTSITVAEAEIPLGEAGARYLLKRTPSSYLFNQAYGLWVFASFFILTLIMTRKVSVVEYGIYAISATAFNTIAYIVAFGLEDATTTFVPRVLAQYGKAAAALLVRRLLALRLTILITSVSIMLFTLPALAALIAAIPLSGSAGVAAGLRNPGLLGHIAPIAFWVLGNGIAGLLIAVYASEMRMRIVFIVGSVIQVFLLVLSFITLQLGWGIDSVLWLLAICSLLHAAALTLLQAPLLLTRGATYKQPMKPVLRVGISAWLTNLVSGALLKQVSIILLAYFAVSVAQIAYFNLSFQLADAASLLLVSGFGGVAGSALAAAFVGMNYERMSRAWQALIKIETLLSAPIMVFCLFNAQAVVHLLYGTNYDSVGPLLAIFLFFNIIVRVLGTTIHQSTLYVMGKPRLVVLGQLVGLVVVIVLGIALIPRWGPAGALVADGISKITMGGLLLAFLWRDLPEKYPLGFTLRVLLALTIATLPEMAWHLSGRVSLVISGTVFLVLAIVLLLLLKPLSAKDLEMVSESNRWAVKYLRWFGRVAKA
jgi:O-antigen/teichoic acid export membrane protein